MLPLVPAVDPAVDPVVDPAVDPVAAPAVDPVVAPLVVDPPLAELDPAPLPADDATRTKRSPAPVAELDPAAPLVLDDAEPEEDPDVPIAPPIRSACCKQPVTVTLP